MANATHFFLGANSGGGFQNLFDRFCKAEDHYDLLILKGGPGCGKSTMMRKVGEAMEELGEQVEYLHCSGDPDSLDGVHIPRIRTAVVDGTAPHSIEARYPAAVERYVDLGKFYDVAAAKHAREQIVHFTDACSDAYRNVYHILAAARKLEEGLETMTTKTLDYERLFRRTDGIIARELRGRGSGGADRYRFLGSLTCKGAITYYDSVENLCPRIYTLLDSTGTAAIMLSRICSAVHARRYSAILCPDPEHMERLQHLMIPELGLAFVSVKEGDDYPLEAHRRIHLDEMLSFGEKGKLRLMRKMIKTLRQEGIDLLRQAKAEHDALEAIYQSGVDFSGINELTKQEIERITGYL